MKKLNLNENFISRIWENPAYYGHLKTLDGKEIKVMNIGKQNHDAGPDYKNARVSIGGTIYTGDIEIHKTSGDWFAHNHKKDAKYNKVILHVVFWGKKSGDEYIPVAKKSRQIPTVILSKFLTRSIHQIWQEIIENPSKSFKLPCYPENAEVEDILKKEWIEKTGSKKLQFKAKKIRSEIKRLDNTLKKKSSWEQVFFESIAEALGYSKNKEPFSKLAGRINIKKIKRHKPGVIQLDALLFGLSGFLKGLRYKNKYIGQLKSEWEILNGKLKIETMDKSEWNFFRLRPSNFPTLRIAYLSAFLYELTYNDFFKRVIKSFEETGNRNKEIDRLFSEIEFSSYWHAHYIFGKKWKSKKKRNSIGDERISEIITNIIIPFTYTYANTFSRHKLLKEVLHYYSATRNKSSNEITRTMENQLFYKIKSICEAQGLIHLHNFYCVKGRCDDCSIGENVFQKDMVAEPLKIILY